MHPEFIEGYILSLVEGPSGMPITTAPRSSADEPAPGTFAEQVRKRAFRSEKKVSARGSVNSATGWII